MVIVTEMMGSVWLTKNLFKIASCLKRSSVKAHILLRKPRGFESLTRNFITM